MRTTNHRHIVSIIILITIGVIVLWSIINIAATARHYHNTWATWLLGFAFGAANAISVYVLATAKTASLRRPAILGSVVFGLGSAIIQTGLYRLEAASWPMAIVFGSMGPAAEAILAWTEAAMRGELENETEPTAHRPSGATALSTEPKPAPRRQTTNQQPPPSPPAQPAEAQPAAPAGGLTSKQIAMLQQIANLAQSESFATDTELADKLQWSETTARRYRQLAEANNLVHRNGDGRYHTN